MIDNIQQIDWYTDFYYPFLNRWADIVRSASEEKKLVFVEAIPNEVRTLGLVVHASAECNFLSSFVPRPGHRNIDPRTWFMPLIGKERAAKDKVQRR